MSLNSYGGMDYGVLQKSPFPMFDEQQGTTACQNHGIDFSLNSIVACVQMESFHYPGNLKLKTWDSMPWYIRIPFDPHVPGATCVIVIGVSKRAHGLPRNKDWTLLDLLRLSRTKYNATDPRDKVFALHGVVTDPGSIGVDAVVNYSKSMEEVYTDVAVHELTQQKTLFYWNHDNERKSILAAGDNFNAALDTLPILSVSEDRKILTVRGFVLDAVSELNNIYAGRERIHMDPTLDMEQKKKRLSVKRAIDNCINLAKAAYKIPAGQRSEDVMWRTLCCDITPDIPSKRAPKEYEKGYQLLENFHEALTEDGEYGYTHELYKSPQFLRDNWIHNSVFLNAVQKFTIARNMRITINGYLGRVPMGSNIDDKICTRKRALSVFLVYHRMSQLLNLALKQFQAFEMVVCREHPRRTSGRSLVNALPSNGNEMIHKAVVPLLKSSGTQGWVYKEVSSQDATCPETPSPLPSAASFPEISTLPDPFTYLDGKTRVNSTEQWYSCRQPEILNFLQEYQYGYYPSHSAETVAATRTGNNVAISVTVASKTASFSAAISLPAGATAASPVPVIIAIGGIDNNVYLSNGIAVVTFDYTTVSPDSTGKTGAFWALYNGRDIGTLTAWAWGFHRVLDALILTAPEIDSTKVGVTGCSRLGKAALAAGLFDTRITLTMPMSSGVQGLGPYRYWNLSGQGENLENSKAGAPWWSDSVLGTFVNQDTRTPFDAHTVAAAIAPRAIIIDQGESDPYTNSVGTATVIFPGALEVYNWLGVGSQIGMALRTGGHCDNSGYTNVLPYVLNILKGTSMTRDYHNLSPWSAMPAAYPWTSSIPGAFKSKLHR
ncbi:hypothetical protein B7494_g4107 [Chlorociboria aeruginascens]|nr:hypothetical protein B7494_g4107 [Chlorociboria aeruginascens]